MLARYAYKDVIFGSAIADGGANATIGVNGADDFSQYSYNAASVSADDYIDVLADDEMDEYRFSANAGQRIDIAFDALQVGDFGTTSMQLIDANNNVLATASSRPISSATAIANYDVGILGYVLPSTGNYSVRVSTSATDYYLAVGEGLAIDTENASGVITPARALPVPSAAMGYLNASDARDLLDLNLTSGQTIRTVLSRPDTAGITPGNNLQPRVNILGPAGTILATNSTFNSAGQIVLSLTATETGRHRLDLRRLAGAGEYYLRVEEVLAPTVASVALSLADERKPMPWHNLADPMDVSDDLKVTALDALLLINELNSRQISSATGQLPPRSAGAAAVDTLFDINGDGLLTAIDALLVINELNRAVSAAR